MKIFLLAVTILLLISRIKSTPRMLSKKIYFRDLSKSIDKHKKTFEGRDEDEISIIYGVTTVLILFFQALLIIYYLLVGNRFLSNTFMLILTALQIVSVFITCSKQLNKKVFSTNIDDHKFYRFNFLFNVVLDYVYYPMVIYLLAA